MSAWRLRLAFFLSGASGLLYEVLWTRQLSTLGGATAPAAQAALATFFIGSAAGGAWLGRRIARQPAVQAARAYARLELAIAAAGAASAVLLALARGPIAAITDGADGTRTAAVALLVGVSACGPAALLMGATLAAIVRALGDADPARPQLAWAYAANTAGAVVGAVAGAFVALPTLGVRGSYGLAVLGNLAAAALSSRQPARPTSPVEPAPPMPPALAFALAAAGFAAITMQIVVIRVLAFTLQDTVYTFALAVAAYVLGAALTSAALGRRSPWPLPIALCAATAVAALGLFLLRLGRPLHQALFSNLASFPRSAAVEALVALCLAVPAAVPTTWAFLALAAHPSAGSPAVRSGRATAWNGVGCALAPVVSALWLLPHIGTAGLAAVAVGALGLAAVASAWLTPARRAPRFVLLAVAASAVGLVRGQLFEWVVAPGWRVIWGAESGTGLVSVEEAPNGMRRLRTNNNFTEGGDGAMGPQARQGLLASLFVRRAQRALVLGVGSGGTLVGVWAGHPGARIDAVELSPDIRRALSFFARSNGRVGDRPHIAVHVADARTFAAHAAARKDTYDLVVGDLFHATHAGTGSLLAREHFETVRALLFEGGAFCQWLPLHETPPAEVKTLVRTFFTVFPYGAAILGSASAHTPVLGLVGLRTPVSLDADELHQRLSAPLLLQAWAHTAGVDDLPETLAAVLAPAEALRRLVGAGPLNTDDRPQVELHAPRGHTARTALDNLIALRSAFAATDAIVRPGRAASRAEIDSVRTGFVAHIGVHAALLAGDVQTADAELRRQARAAPALSTIDNDLAEVVKAWGWTNTQSRAQALIDAVAQARKAATAAPNP